MHKKKSKFSKENYRPISILPSISKVYERCLYDQMTNFFEDVLSKYQCGFRKGYNVQHCLLVIIEKWKKLEAYGFQTDALNLVYEYLSNRKQRVKINETFSSWKDIEYGVPQGSILGPLLFNTHLCDLFYFLEDLDIASKTDDTTIYTVKENKESVINTLKASSLPLFTWFNSNFMKPNSHKSHILLTCSEPSTALIDGSSSESNTKEILLRITIDRDRKFDEHVNNLCKKACQKLNCLFCNIHERW